jgi:hypothetical protein
MHRNDLCDTVREAVLKAWPRGIQSESSASPQIRVLKLRGRPWLSRDTLVGTTGETLAGLHLLVYLVERLEGEGWGLVGGMDVGSKVNTDDEFHPYCEDGELLVFERRVKGVEDGPGVCNNDNEEGHPTDLNGAGV